ncbi:unnamed protein product [Bursaphelenchus xylophilus]|uniref:(pine wood nematode) hypothetical protein n=1 Tax=Bursaphelenchus xylophilus TaxID=6326 RepID=A0A1I7SUJ4_BURXY|nr:unnamed protein product [Bursaphelenchus xylophilus]CAG9107061.1 unnamed protein product [Bursaphelenchus xylophilus]
MNGQTSPFSCFNPFLSIYPPLPPVFIPPLIPAQSSSISSISTGSNDSSTASSTPKMKMDSFSSPIKREELSKENKAQMFLIEKLLQLSQNAINQSKRATPEMRTSPEVMASSSPPIIPPLLPVLRTIPQPSVPSVEYVNGGYGVKNPLLQAVGTSSPTIDTTPAPTTTPGIYRCRICGKEFHLQRLLNRHAKCHSDLKRYLCTFCGKGFNDTFDLKRHTRTHTGVRPYKCEMCDKSFTQRCSLESHTRKVHGKTHCYGYKERRSKVFVCEDCGFTAPAYDEYTSHLQANHPLSAVLLKLNHSKYKLDH